MYMIEITEDKANKLSEHLEQGLRHIGKAMQCIDEVMNERGSMGNRDGGRYGDRYNEGGMNERGGYGNRGDYGDRYRNGGYGNRDEEEHWNEMQERRRRDSRGRYM